MENNKKKISVVVSCYNEELSLNKFYEETAKILQECSWDYELIFVNDGSVDSSFSILGEIAKKDSRVLVVNFARNFGHEAAMIAGIDYSTGDGIVCMDADLQHPPESIVEIISKFEEGYDVISMVRTENKDVGIVKKVTSFAFYKVLNMISPVKFESNASDFFAVSKKVAKVLRNEYREKVRYLRGYVQSVGFNKTVLEFRARKREAGKSKYNIRKLIKFSVNAICSFSDLPLKMGVYSGVGVGVLGIVLMLYTLINKFINGAPGGYTTIVATLCFLFAVNLFVIGIIGQYIAVLFAEVKNRPIYIVSQILNGEDKSDD